MKDYIYLNRCIIWFWKTDSNLRQGVPKNIAIQVFARCPIIISQLDVAECPIIIAQLAVAECPINIAQLCRFGRLSLNHCPTRCYKTLYWSNIGASRVNRTGTILMHNVHWALVSCLVGQSVGRSVSWLVMISKKGRIHTLSKALVWFRRHAETKLDLLCVPV